MLLFNNLFRKKKFEVGQEVSLKDGKKTHPNVLKFYKLHPALIGQPLTIVKIGRRVTQVTTLAEQDLLIPTSMLRKYVKEPNHRLTSVFM